MKTPYPVVELCQAVNLEILGVKPEPYGAGVLVRLDPRSPQWLEKRINNLAAARGLPRCGIAFSYPQNAPDTMHLNFALRSDMEVQAHG